MFRVHLPPNAREVFADVCSSLPKTADDTQETITARAKCAMDAVFALHPEDAFQAPLAERIVAMDAHAIDALRATAIDAGDPEKLRQCRAQAALHGAPVGLGSARAAARAGRARQGVQRNAPRRGGRAGYWFK
jgi:hypothetical protein